MAYRIYKQKPYKRNKSTKQICPWLGRWYVVTRTFKVYLYSRAVMEGHLKRPLHSSELVVNINGDKADDRIENLQLISRGEAYKNILAKSDEDFQKDLKALKERN